MFRAPLPSEGYPDFIKRCIGLPGDTIDIKKGVVYIDGTKLDEPYRPDPPNPLENRGPYHVPPHQYFMMGDNRENSYDSRWWGYVPRENIIGTPVLIYMSIDAPEEVWIRTRRRALRDVLELHHSSGRDSLEASVPRVLDFRILGTSGSFSFPSESRFRSCATPMLE